ncbi:hypothetical protein [Pseudobacteriovorax antillogorgiicola]|uniref:Uncharacterized protein n=1 Tax=Pseudobacteriovorax antillogorgiicola TaxID=1513793 RepID=A0A1Y6CLE8_9BACT|nr:hypothetical protein [Pseudobacteriovorax antillogorgiicola]TCS45432.1 hypothetical protein EDD56_12843 [Pseudobacteriovorax antillogorgiicola]SMF74255.1 hypothetical protein SAMN06296036_12843 [Pseudobacteriovorax antillogorgiicola]
MSKEVVEYFASKSALVLWFALSSVFCLLLLIRISTSSAELSVVKMIFFVTDMIHFWIPIFACKYLDRINKNK